LSTQPPNVGRFFDGTFEWRNVYRNSRCFRIVRSPTAQRFLVLNGRVGREQIKFWCDNRRKAEKLCTRLNERLARQSAIE
jgi:hypothetical protein